MLCGTTLLRPHLSSQLVPLVSATAVRVSRVIFACWALNLPAAAAAAASWQQRMRHVPPRQTQALAAVVYIWFYSLICPDINKQLRVAKKERKKMNDEFIENKLSNYSCSSCSQIVWVYMKIGSSCGSRNLRAILIRKLLQAFFPGPSLAKFYCRQCVWVAKVVRAATTRRNTLICIIQNIYDFTNY